MSNLAVASATGILDIIAQQYALLTADLGTGVETGTCSKGAANGWALAVADADTPADWSVANLLATGLKKWAERMKTASAEAGYSCTARDLFAEILRDLQTELDGSIDTWLTSNSQRVHPNVQALHYLCFGTYLTPENVFPAPAVEMGHTVRGASVWTYTDGTAIVPATVGYGGGQLELYVPAGVTIGAADCVLSLTLTKPGGSSESKSVTMPMNSVAGTAVDVGSSTDLYIDVTACTVTGGTSGDQVYIRTKTLRDISTSCA